jgi:hypothetical protein
MSFIRRAISAESPRLQFLITSCFISLVYFAPYRLPDHFVNPALPGFGLYVDFGLAGDRALYPGHVVLQAAYLDIEGVVHAADFSRS